VVSMHLGPGDLHCYQWESHNLYSLNDLSVQPHAAVLQGVLLTHCHMGHFIGLAQFGREAMNANGLKVTVKRGL